MLLDQKLKGLRCPAAAQGHRPFAQPPTQGGGASAASVPAMACVRVLSLQPRSPTIDLDSGLQGNLREKPAISQKPCTSPGLDVSLSLQSSTLTPRLHRKLLHLGEDSAPFLSLAEGGRCGGESGSPLPSAFAFGDYSGPPLDLSYICKMGPITPMF